METLSACKIFLKGAIIRPSLSKSESLGNVRAKSNSICFSVLFFSVSVSPIDFTEAKSAWYDDECSSVDDEGDALAAVLQRIQFCQTSEVVGTMFFFLWRVQSSVPPLSFFFGGNNRLLFDY